jgi:hypothetical protein
VFEAFPQCITSALCALIYHYWGRPCRYRNILAAQRKETRSNVFFQGPCGAAVYPIRHITSHLEYPRYISLLGLLTYFPCAMRCNRTLPLLPIPTRQCYSFGGVPIWPEKQENEPDKGGVVENTRQPAEPVFCQVVPYGRVWYIALPDTTPQLHGTTGELVNQSSDNFSRWRHQTAVWPTGMQKPQMTSTKDHQPTFPSQSLSLAAN